MSIITWNDGWSILRNGLDEIWVSSWEYCFFRSIIETLKQRKDVKKEEINGGLKLVITTIFIGNMSYTWNYSCQSSLTIF